MTAAVVVSAVPPYRHNATAGISASFALPRPQHDPPQQPAGMFASRQLGPPNSSCERRRSLGFLAVETRCKRLTLLIVRKLHGKNDRLVVLIVFELRRLVTVAIEPFAHGGHSSRKLGGRQAHRDRSHQSSPRCLFIDNDHVSCPGEEGFRPNDARFCEALALQNPLSQPCKERSKVMGSKGEEIIVSV